MGSPDMSDGSSGTPYLLYRSDRARVTRGAEKLELLRLNAESATRRQVASCCSTPMFVDFDHGPHWISVYRNGLSQGAPAIEMRLQVRFAPDREALPKDVPAYDSVSPGFVWRLVKARIAMLFG